MTAKNLSSLFINQQTNKTNQKSTIAYAILPSDHSASMHMDPADGWFYQPTANISIYRPRKTLKMKVLWVKKCSQGNKRLKVLY